MVSDLIGFDKISDIEDNLKLVQVEMKSFFESLVSKSKRKWGGDKGFFILLAILFILNEKQLDEFKAKCDWTPEIIERVIETIKEIKNRS